jgi:hypothetical protein
MNKMFAPGFARRDEAPAPSETGAVHDQTHAARREPRGHPRRRAGATGVDGARARRRHGDRTETTVASTVTRLAAAGVLERSELPGGGVGVRAPGPAID